MTDTPLKVDEHPKENWFMALTRPVIQPVLESYRRNDCNGSAYELGAEIGLATYVITAFVLKRKQSAFKYSVAAFMIVPLIAWPICMARKEQLKPKEL